MEKPQVLIFDTNTVFAKRIGAVIQEHAPGVQVDYAQNLPVLQRRLAEKRYTLVLADPSTAFDVEGAEHALYNLQNEHNVPVVIWSFLNRIPQVEGCHFNAVFRKPLSLVEMSRLNVGTLLNTSTPEPALV